MNIKRQLFSKLEKWKAEKKAKPLIIRGARQVGKTTIIKELGKQFKFFISLNLEKEKDQLFFKQFSDAKTIVEALFLEYNIPKKEISNTLLFIDEIQECSKAIQLLRYFYEDVPELKIIAAGSLLEFALNEIKNFPVGRIEYLYLSPFNFLEFLQALNHSNALEKINQIPIDKNAHNTLIQLFHQYAIIGGMPEVVVKYIENKSVLDLPKVYESIWATYKNDVVKYAKNENARNVIKHIINTAHLFIDQRIKFQHFGNSNYASREVKECFRNLHDAKIIQLIYPSTDVEIPIKPNIKKSPKIQFLDTGILNYTLGIQAEMLALNDFSKLYKGAIIPHLIIQELISINFLNNQVPHFWVREKNTSSAEVDLVMMHKNKIIPVEIKSGKTGTLKSLHQFIDASSHPFAVRVYAGSFLIEEQKTITGKPYLLMNLPYYLGTKITEYITYFISNFQLK